jgi:hypothetical protein
LAGAPLLPLPSSGAAGAARIPEDPRLVEDLISAFFEEDD